VLLVRSRTDSGHGSTKHSIMSRSGSGLVSKTRWMGSIPCSSRRYSHPGASFRIHWNVERGSRWNSALTRGFSSSAMATRGIAILGFLSLAAGSVGRLGTSRCGRRHQ
jgi:hypothetical protein